MRIGSYLAFLFVPLMLIWPGMTSAQSFQGTTGAELHVGLTIPVGTASDYWHAGPLGRLSLRFPATNEISVGLEAGFVAPASQNQDASTFQIPLRCLIYVPLAGEAASTPYFAFGPGATINVASIKVPNEKSETTSDTYFAYAFKAGYLLRPESMTNTFFDLGLRYEQQIITRADDWRNIDLEVGVGLNF